MTDLDLILDPHLPLPLLIGLGALAALIFFISFLRVPRGSWLRLLAALLLLTALLGPAVKEAKYELFPAIVYIAVDQSGSMTIENRKSVADALAGKLETQLQEHEHVDVRRMTFGRPEAQDTELFEGLSNILADIPPQRRGALFIVSDGQIHDSPQNRQEADSLAARLEMPVHLILTGQENAFDRRIDLIKAPAYGMIGQTAAVSFTVQQQGASSTGRSEAAPVPVTIRFPDGTEETRSVLPDETVTINAPLPAAGPNMIFLQIPVAMGELTAANNALPVTINGVRDRLRVLLVSGKPHQGTRIWRDYLSSDPAVDLVHFTILREPDKIDATPPQEMSLIAFPFRELFEIKLYDFDLIIFDRYRLNNVMPERYFRNIERYVNEGGGLLEISGPAYASEESLYNTALANVLPGIPAGFTQQGAFTPALSDKGRQHPVTSPLAGLENGWGPWLRYVPLFSDSGDVVLEAKDEQPLLILDRVGEGRVAHMASDQIWLWGRDYANGGPYNQLLLRLVHWLMKEPALEEDALRATAQDLTLTIEKTSLAPEPPTVTITHPDNTQETIELSERDGGVFRATYRAKTPGVYQITHESQSRFVLAGAMHSREFEHIHASDAPLSPLLQSSGGGVYAAQDTEAAAPSLRTMPQTATYHGRTWAGIKRSDARNVQSVAARPFLPDSLFLLLLAAGLIVAWLWESRRN